MIRYYGQENVPGAPVQGVMSPNVRFNPNNLNVQPGPGYFQNPGYSPFLHDQDRDRFILHDPRSGVAATPSFDINRRPGSLGGRSGEQLKRIYEGGTQQNEQLNEELRKRGIMPGGPQLPMAMGMGSIGNMAGMMQVPAGFQNKIVS